MKKKSRTTPRWRSWNTVPNKRRKFDGKRYSRFATFRKKSGAQFSAGRLRSGTHAGFRGTKYNARVVKEDVGHSVYYNKARRTRK